MTKIGQTGIMRRKQLFLLHWKPKIGYCKRCWNGVTYIHRSIRIIKEEYYLLLRKRITPCKPVHAFAFLFTGKEKTACKRHVSSIAFI